MLAKSALKYAGEVYRGRGERRETQKIDLEPLHRKLDVLIAAQPQRWMYYAILAVSCMTLLLVIAVLIRM